MVRPILMVVGSWVVISVPVSLLMGRVLRRLDTEARRQAPLAKVLELELHSARLYGRSAPVQRQRRRPVLQNVHIARIAGVGS